MAGWVLRLSAEPQFSCSVLHATAHLASCSMAYTCNQRAAAAGGWRGVLLMELRM